jgi:hypothetical protein
MYSLTEPCRADDRMRAVLGDELALGVGLVGVDLAAAEAADRPAAGTIAAVTVRTRPRVRSIKRK